LDFERHDLTMRPMTGRAELELFRQLPYVLNSELADDLESGRRRPEWMWLALRGDRLVARLAWWRRRQDGPPFLLDVLDLDDAMDEKGRVGIAAALLRTAMAKVLPAGARPPAYTRFIPPDWRDDAVARRAIEARMAALERTGARLFVERLRLEWRAGTPIPAPSGRLKFRPVSNREELVKLMTGVSEGTLDAHSRRDLARTPAAQVAAEQYDGEFMSYDSPRDWWQIGMLPDGEPVGFVIPARNSYHPIIAYIGVLPAHRGNGYVDDLLAEGTRILAAHEVPRIRASTDLGNVPMAHSFQRTGYLNFEREINMTWS
jgi:ribosomal protein S18 acetylase RimI-like enzyme